VKPAHSFIEATLGRKKAHAFLKAGEPFLSSENEKAPAKLAGIYLNHLGKPQKEVNSLEPLEGRRSVGQ
jgi:hypothetical protein